MQKLEEFASWNKKRIFIGFIAILAVLTLLGYGIKTFVLGKNIDFFSKKTTLGTSTQKQENASLPTVSSIQNSLQQKLGDIQQEVSKLDIAEIASSSPQIQKLIKDINALKDYPGNQVKDICQNICNSL